MMEALGEQHDFVLLRPSPPEIIAPARPLNSSLPGVADYF